MEGCTADRGPVGEGNFHLAFVLGPDDPGEMGRACRLNDRRVGCALAMGGTCTGEHGIGLGKIEHLAAECGTGAAVMSAGKSALHPHGILNPGKLFASGQG